MSIGKDIKKLKEITSEQQAIGESMLKKAGITLKSHTIEDVNDNIPTGASVYTSRLIYTTNAALDEAYTA